MSKAHGGFQVRQHNPWRFWLVSALVLLLLLVMFLFGRAYQSYEVTQLKFQKQTLQARIEELEARNARLVKTNARLESDSRIEHDAYTQSKGSLLALQKKLLEMKEQLVFYQGIVSPEELSLGVNIQSFELARKGDLGLYYYKLVLSKRGKSSKFVKGRFDFIVKGKRDEKPLDLPLKQIKQGYSDKDTKFSFRYFQVFEGELMLPEKFEPYDIQLKINPTTKKIKSFSETISWAQAVSGGVN